MFKIPVLLILTLLVASSLTANISSASVLKLITTPSNGTAGASANSSAVVNVTGVTPANVTKVIKKDVVALITKSSGNITANANTKQNTTKNVTVTLTLAEIIAQIIANAKAQAANIVAQSHKPKPVVPVNVSKVHIVECRMPQRM